MGKNQDVKAKMAMKPGAVSLAPEWSTTRVDDLQGFKTVKKSSGNGNNNQQWKPSPQPVAAAAHRPAEKKFVPQDYVVGAAPVGGQVQGKKQSKPKQIPKVKPAKQQLKTSWDEEDDAGWVTAGAGKTQQQEVKQVKQVKDSLKSEKQLKNEQNWQKKKAIKEHNAGVVGAAPVDPVEEKRKQQKEAKEAKKRMQELAKQQQAKQAAAHSDPNDGFTTVTKSGVKAKKVKGIDAFGTQTAFSGLQKNQPQHKKLPKALKERTVKELTEEEKQEQLKLHREKLTAKPTDVEIEFKIKVQGNWFAIKSLLNTKDFEHAPKFIAAACTQQEKIVGGFFISADGKHLTNESTADELWMCTSFLSGTTKLLNNKEDVSITPYWPPAKSGKDATTTLHLVKSSLQEECYPSMTLSHTQKQATALQEVNVSIHQFAAALLKEVEQLEIFCDKLHTAAASLTETKRWKGKDKQQQIKDFLEKLPTKLDSVSSDLSYAVKEFNENHPMPQE